MFKFLDQLYYDSINEKNKPIDKPIDKPIIINRCTDIKQYKKDYYKENIEIYKERNRKYRETHKKTKKEDIL